MNVDHLEFLRWRFAALVFAGVLLLLIALSPGAIGDQAYNGEEIRAGSTLLDQAAGVLYRQPAASKLSFTRHGMLPLVYDAPFLLVARLFPDRKGWEDRLVAWRPIFFTAGLATLVFLWTMRLTSRPGWSVVVAVLSVFSTLLWPYASIGLEDTQSFFLLLTGYLAFESHPLGSWLRTAGFACAAACAISTKSTGILLVPAVVLLSTVAYRRADLRSKSRIVVVSLFAAVVLSLSAWSRVPFWRPWGGSFNEAMGLAIHDPISWVSNLISFFFSANKGLFVYCPLLVFAAAGLPALWRQGRRQLVLFVLLVVFGLACGFSLLKVWTDETWGPRYLHATIAPLMVCFGVAWVRRTKRLTAFIAAAAAVGVTIAFLGAFFLYERLQATMTDAGQDTLENMQGDVVWNPIRFHARLFGIWVTHRSPVFFTPAHTWYYAVPPDEPAWKSVEISRYAVPLPYLVRSWHTPLSGVPLWYRWALEFALLMGLASIGFAIALSRNLSASEAPVDPSVDKDRRQALRV